MRARDLAEPFPFVTTDDDAARMLAERSLLVLDSDGQPHAIVPGSQLLRQLLPAYIAEDPALAGVVGDQHDGELAGFTVAEWAPRRLYPSPTTPAPSKPRLSDEEPHARTAHRHRRSQASARTHCSAQLLNRLVGGVHRSAAGEVAQDMLNLRGAQAERGGVRGSGPS
ncbi:hypothetical protein ACGFYM_37505 [Streptomyces sp. NPDC048231]|uniref:hypothetical protein n=1 Tax=Streptomyces sp. NPDC048231 TaxID=3365519 RepID=UPI0037185580